MEYDVIDGDNLRDCLEEAEEEYGKNFKVIAVDRREPCDYELLIEVKKRKRSFDDYYQERKESADKG